MRIDFRNTVPIAQRSAVERLFFFHPKQADRLSQIRVAVERFGTPVIKENNDGLSLGDDGDSMQCLFACDGDQDPMKIAGAVLYLRPRLDRIVIAHLAVDDAYQLWVDEEGISICVTLVYRVRSIARCIKGVTQLELPYHPGRCLAV